VIQPAKWKDKGFELGSPSPQSNGRMWSEMKTGRRDFIGDWVSKDVDIHTYIQWRYSPNRALTFSIEAP
jgi:hypothetical protein